jgi:hypothetical protein
LELAVVFIGSLPVRRQSVRLLTCSLSTDSEEDKGREEKKAIQKGRRKTKGIAEERRR